MSLETITSEALALAGEDGDSALALLATAAQYIAPMPYEMADHLARVVLSVAQSHGAFAGARLFALALHG
jgi:hypothetical protein